MAQAIEDCQGDWWLWGGSICRKPYECLADAECYFVVQYRRGRRKQIMRELAALAEEQHAEAVG